MYQNKVTLIGFLGSDAEVRSNDNCRFTTLSVATKSSYKKDGKYVSQTEWHRCIVFGKLSAFAGKLKKGAHIQVEGELRSREIEKKKKGTKKRVWEVRVDSILKLDRAEMAVPDEIEPAEALGPADPGDPPKEPEPKPFWLFARMRESNQNPETPEWDESQWIE
jgi:single-strand DNA-binding protein